LWIIWLVIDIRVRWVVFEVFHERISITDERDALVFKNLFKWDVGMRGYNICSLIVNMPMFRNVGGRIRTGTSLYPNTSYLQ